MHYLEKTAETYLTMDILYFENCLFLCLFQSYFIKNNEILGNKNKGRSSHGTFINVKCHPRLGHWPSLWYTKERSKHLLLPTIALAKNFEVHFQQKRSWSHA